MRVCDKIVVRRVTTIPHNGGVHVYEEETLGVVVIAFLEDLISEFAAHMLEQALNRFSWAVMDDPGKLLSLCVKAEDDNRGGVHERAARPVRYGRHGTR